MTVAVTTPVCIGIHVHARADHLLSTVASVQANTDGRVEVVLLPDGPDVETAGALATLAKLRALPQWGSSEALGPPACFNRLVTGSDAAVAILLESGSVVGPGWLDLLLAPILDDPWCGLTGPSTNRSWNAQGAFPQGAGDAAAVARTAAEARRRYGASTRSLGPLHSLADFCYAVRRDVIETIGAADEGFGTGPCWEMEYNARAARAGFRAKWACASYVYRSPFTPRRMREEWARFEESKKRYQDRLCGLRLRGESTAYEPHCKGDDCPHFAPPADIVVRVPFAPSVRAVVAVPPGTAVKPRVPADIPLVSCVMPTSGRPQWVQQAVAYFQRQDYPRRELIIVDDGEVDVAPWLPDDNRIRLVRTSVGRSIGAKRNQACELAAGAIIAHWDDDDWYADNRLSYQVEPLLHDARADVTGLVDPTFFDVDGWKFWRCTPVLHQRLFVLNVHGGTLVYRRHVWERLARYPDASLAEDATFLQRAVFHGARLERLPAAGLFLYVRHRTNSWRLRCGETLDPTGWQSVAEPALPGGDRRFYAARSGHGPSCSPKAPLVSCIMPTADRRRFVAQAIRYFLGQDYPNRELIVLDDGADRVEDLMPADTRVRYVGLERRMILGAKRNLGCHLAEGELIAHWDDDDWQAPDRLQVQVAAMVSSQADVSGCRALLYYEPATDTAWRYEYPAGLPRWVAGNTLCYRREAWERSPFPEIAIGEDSAFTRSRDPDRMAVLEGNLVIGIIHATNTSAKQTAGLYWSRHPVEDVQRMLGDDLETTPRVQLAEDMSIGRPWVNSSSDIFEQGTLLFRTIPPSLR